MLSGSVAMLFCGNIVNLLSLEGFFYILSITGLYVHSMVCFMGMQNRVVVIYLIEVKICNISN